MISEPIARLAQTVHLSCVLINIISKRTKMSFHLTHVTKKVHRVSELPLDPRHHGVPSGVPKMIFEPIGHSVQTMQLSCVEISTISKETKMSFYLTHII
jgi:hypothetical protein